VEYLADYASFLARVVTVVIAVLLLLAAATAIRSKGRSGGGRLQVSKINEFYKNLQARMQESILDKAQLKAVHKAEAKAEKQARKAGESRSRVYVLDFDGDIRASAVDSLRHEVTALLALASPADEVVLRLESPGGMVHSYGLAASQLARVRQASIPLTVCVDKVAASGGYMMACIGNRILAAPFAVLGSIGVVAQLPNVHRLLKKHNVDFEVLTAGEYKRTLTVFGENTEKGREKFQQDLDTTHEQFKGFVGRYRPQLDMDLVATGEIWLGEAARGMQLVDELMTSDEYLAGKARTCDLFHLHYVEKKNLMERFGMATSAAAERSLFKVWDGLSRQRFWQ
jgi:serine protease SohB